MTPFPPAGPNQDTSGLLPLYGSSEKLFGAAAHAYNLMVLAARRDGVELVAVSGHRLNAEQWELYRRYKNGTGNLAAYPGTSKHEYGRAVDVLTGTQAADPPVVVWLRRNAARFGFRETVRGERWHWAFVGTDNVDERINMGDIDGWWEDLRVLKPGERHDGVELMQRALVAAGYQPGPVDGVWGGKTQLAFAAWENTTYPNAASDGLPGKYSWPRLLRDTLDTATATSGDAQIRADLIKATNEIGRLRRGIDDSAERLQALRDG